jgi:hypothetical protein
MRVNGGGSEDYDPSPWHAYISVMREFKIKIGGENLSIFGTYFCQQNSITNVCAHACTLMMLNNMKGSSKLLYAEDINQLLGIDHEHRRQEVSPDGLADNTYATHDGLFQREIKRVIREYGYRPYIFEESNAAVGAGYRENIYSFIESGYPALLMFDYIDGDGKQTSHVVAIVGHSLNRHSWFPNAYASYNQSPRPGFTSTLGWVNDFIVHDDNFGMQLCLPAHSFSPENGASRNAPLRPTCVIGILPERLNVNLSGPTADVLAYFVLQRILSEENFAEEIFKHNYYVQHLHPHIMGQCGHSPTAVSRCFVIESSSYLESIKLKDNFGNSYDDGSLDKISKSLGKHKALWLVEVTEPELYAGNRTKVIDVLIATDISSNSIIEGHALEVFVRFPEALLVGSIDSNKVSAQKIVELKGVAGHLPLAAFEQQKNLMP